MAEATTTKTPADTTPSSSDAVEHFPDAHNLDEESLEEQFFRLQMEEIQESRARTKGKQREGTKSDFDMALEAFQAEVESFQFFQTDQRMVQSMATALLEDDNMIATLNEQEKLAQSDRNIALGIENHEDGNELVNPDTKDEGTAPRSQEDSVKVSYEENLKRQAMKENFEVALLYHSSNQSRVDHSIPTAESSSTAAKRTYRPQTIQGLAQVELRDCVACTHTFSVFDLANLPCGHEYCRGCISKLFADSMVDESLFPPRCCRMTITVEHIRAFLYADIANEFIERKEELETPNRTYCRMPECSKFIPKDAIHQDIGCCTICGVNTCCICKGTPHQGTDCPEDPAVHAVLDTARAAGWRQCYSCLRIVELTHGCNHVTCRCNAQFCYECGAPWRTCECEQWREDRLLGREEDDEDDEDDEESDSDEGSEINAPTDWNERRRILRTANYRIRFYRCTHETWRQIPGRHQCQECTDMLPHYVFECQRCRLRACYRCRRNRL